MLIRTTIAITALLGAVAGSPSAQMLASTTSAPLFSYSTLTNVNYRAQDLAIGRVVVAGKCLVLRSNDGLTVQPVVFDQGVRINRTGVKLLNGKHLSFGRSIDKLHVGASPFSAKLIDGLDSACFAGAQTVVLLY
jgi:hypothetical protein